MIPSQQEEDGARRPLQYPVAIDQLYPICHDRNKRRMKKIYFYIQKFAAVQKNL